MSLFVFLCGSVCVCVKWKIIEYNIIVMENNKHL